MPKDRLLELQEKIEKNPDDEIHISTIKHFAVIDMEAPLLDAFLHRIDLLRDALHQLAAYVENVLYLQDIMLASLTTAGTKEKLEEKMMDVRVLAHQIRKELNQMRQMDALENKESFQRIVESQIETMAKTFCFIMDKYYRAIVIYRETCKERVQRQCHLVGFVKSDEEIEQIIDSGSFSMYPQIIFETKQAKQQLDLMKLRQEEINKLERHIEQIRELFFDLAHLVESQRDSINHITNNIMYTMEKIRQVPWIIPRHIDPHPLPRKFSFRRLIFRLFKSCI